MSKGQWARIEAFGRETCKQRNTVEWRINETATVCLAELHDTDVFLRSAQ